MVLMWWEVEVVWRVEGDEERRREKREGFLTGAVCTGGGEGEWRDPKIGILMRSARRDFGSSENRPGRDAEIKSMRN